MTGEELLKNWADESNAANDCICQILDDYIRFIRYVRIHAMVNGEIALKNACEERLAEWKPILKFAQKHKEK